MSSLGLPSAVSRLLVGRAAGSAESRCVRASAALSEHRGEHRDQQGDRSTRRLKPSEADADAPRDAMARSIRAETHTAMVERSSGRRRAPSRRAFDRATSLCSSALAALRSGSHASSEEAVRTVTAPSTCRGSTAGAPAFEPLCSRRTRHRRVELSSDCPPRSERPTGSHSARRTPSRSPRAL